MNGMHHNNTPLLSICIPTWNRAEFLEKSLISIYNQINTIPFGEIELYISDNCSDDSTSEVVDKYIQLGIPITYNRNECNLGAAKNFLQCMRWASGKYILLLGDDDILKAGAINTILSNAQNSTEDFNNTNVEIFFKDKMKFEALVNTKSKSAIGWENERPIRHFDLLKRLKDSKYEETIPYIEKIKNNVNEKSVDEILTEFDNNIINEDMKKLLKMFLLERRKRMLEIYNLKDEV